MALILSRRNALKTFAVAAAALGVLSKATFNTPIKKEESMTYKLGKNPARKGYGLRLRDYVSKGVLPPLMPTGDFGHESYIRDWQMLGNGPDPSNPAAIPDGVGDCAIAGPYHAEMLWNAVGGRNINIDTNSVINAYSEVTGYVLGDDSTDQGSDVHAVSNYWHRTGFLDKDGNRHKIDAWANLTPGNMEELLYAIYLFDVVGIGVEFPMEWMTALNNGEVWDVVDEPSIGGGHYVIGVGWKQGHINVVTWGQEQLLTPAGYEEFADEAVVYVSRERLLSSGKDLRGFDLDQLMADFKELPKLGG